MSSTTYYHLTPLENLDEILQQGLQARYGERSELAGESEAAIFLFTSAAAVDDACLNWLCDYFDEDQALAALAVNMDHLPEYHTDDSFEVAVWEGIGPEHLTLISKDLLAETQNFTQLLKKLC